MTFEFPIHIGIKTVTTHKIVPFTNQKFQKFTIQYGWGHAKLPVLYGRRMSCHCTSFTATSPPFSPVKRQKNFIVGTSNECFVYMQVLRVGNTHQPAQLHSYVFVSVDLDGPVCLTCVLTFSSVHNFCVDQQQKQLQDIIDIIDQHLSNNQKANTHTKCAKHCSKNILYLLWWPSLLS